MTVYSSLNSQQVLTQADISSTAATVAAAASSLEGSDAGTFANDSAASAGWSSCTGFSVSVLGRMLGVDNAVDDGWNLP